MSNPHTVSTDSVDAELRLKVRKEIQSLKDGLDTNATNAAKCAWCEETEDNIMQLLTQARKGYKSEHRPKQELVCEICDCHYPVWFASNELWNQVMRHPDGKEASEKHNFVCMDCFATEAEKLGVKPTAWMLTTQAETDQKVAAGRREELVWVHDLIVDSDLPHTSVLIKERIAKLNPHTPPQEQK